MAVDFGPYATLQELQDDKAARLPRHYGCTALVLEGGGAVYLLGTRGWVDVACIDKNKDESNDPR